MGAQHTQGQLIHHPEDNIFTIDGRRVFEVQARSLDVTCAERDANARRFAACWNACERIPTEMLETIAGLMPATVPYHQLHSQRDGLLAQLRNLVQMARTSGGTAGPDPALMRACESAEDVIAKTESA